ncbi:hypothetical protein [Phenylobacterium sp.]|nr:hypothetical protein [Phenylobacterium sp.]
MPVHTLDPDLAKEIDALMAGPVPPRPTVIVVGDEDIIGFTPAPGWKGQA